MSRPKGRTFEEVRSFHFTRRDLRDLKAAATWRGISQAEFVRQALREALRVWHEERSK